MRPDESTRRADLSGRREPGRGFVAALLVLGMLTLVIAVAWLFNTASFFLHSSTATAKVQEFHRSNARSATVIGQVVVTMAGRPAFRTEVTDTFGSLDWTEGGNVALRCTETQPGYIDCAPDAGWLGIALLPLAFIAAGAALSAWAARQWLRHKQRQ